MPTQDLIERIQRAPVLLAYLIELDGDVHIAMYEQFEKELEALKQRESTKDRARQLLMAYSDFTVMKASVSTESHPMAETPTPPDWDDAARGFAEAIESAGPTAAVPSRCRATRSQADRGALPGHAGVFKVFTASVAAVTWPDHTELVYSPSRPHLVRRSSDWFAVTFRPKRCRRGRRKNR